MSLVKFLTWVFYMFTVVLLFKKNTMGNLFMIFGGLTFVFVLGYSSILAIPASLQKLVIFLMFSLMIVLFGLTIGILMKMFKRSNKTSRITAAIASILLIVLLFNIRVCVSYMYIPVLLYMLQEKLNNKFINKSIII